MPGLAISITIGFAASFLGEHYGAPTMLFALLLGMALGFLYENERSVAGINFAGSEILRVGVALLGLRIAFSDVMNVGAETLVLIAAGVASTMILGTALARLTGMRSVFGALTGGAVAICGASAALAISAVLPNGPEKEKNTIFTVIGVTSLSTLAMIFYPIIAGVMGHSDADAGLFLGATIHDVAQVVGAGYSISDDAGNTATLIKLIRVAFLVPVVFLVALMFGNRETSGGMSSLLPAFLLGFAGLIVLNSLVSIPSEIKDVLTAASRFMLVTAIAAIGLKSNLKELTNVGFRPVILMVIETVWLAAFVLIAIEMGVQ